MPAAIPEFDSPEYERLRSIRREMFATWAREFPEILAWVVGAESAFYYYYSSGTELNERDLIRFFVDTLQDAKLAIKSANPSALTVAHFVAGDTPANIRGKVVQPREMFALLLQEIERRGGKSTDYFDRGAWDFDPTILEDRKPRVPVFWNRPIPAREESRSSEPTEQAAAELVTARTWQDPCSFR